ncbi:MAG: ABC transporter permease, partial [Rhodospirillales bacterium]|nr:ABC transporter permease [Rhodospirillales bacterium]
MSTSILGPDGVAAAPSLPDVLPPRKKRGPVALFIYRHPTIAAGGALLAVMVLIALLAPLLDTVDPTALSPAKRLRAPSELYWFGTDMLGRDIYSRVMYGARVSLGVGFAVAALSSVIGTFIGLISGFTRFLDAILMRIMDGLMSIPPILLAIALMALTRGSVT